MPQPIGAVHVESYPELFLIRHAKRLTHFQQYKIELMSACRRLQVLRQAVYPERDGESGPTCLQ